NLSTRTLCLAGLIQAPICHWNGRLCFLSQWPTRNSPGTPAGHSAPPCGKHDHLHVGSNKLP
ncbi:Hypothetical protein FKW44_005362, partial [Caligus rogercresseyi]